MKTMIYTTKKTSVDTATTKRRQLTRGGEERGGLSHGNHLLSSVYYRWLIY